MNIRVVTYILRGLGFLLILPSLFSTQLMNIFPALEDYAGLTKGLFFAGVILFFVGAVIYFFTKSTEKASKSKYR